MIGPHRMRTDGQALLLRSLSIERTATEIDIKSAFRKQAMQCHPDRHPGDKDAEHRFKEINEAYEVLKDPDKRAAYDRFGHAAFEQGGMGGGQAGFGAEFGTTFSDLFEGIFGMSGARGRAAPAASAAPICATIWKSRCRKRMPARMRKSAFRPRSPARPAPAPAPRPAPSRRPVAICGGQGRVRHAQGFFTLERTCPNCHGRGQSIDSPCASCAGSGRVTRERTLAVNIPAGVEDGTRIRLSGEGEAGVRGGPPGDLYIFLSIGSHPFFQREGADLHCRVPVSMVTAAMGGDCEVPTIDGGKTKVKVPEGTQSGRRFRLQGKGMPVLRTRQNGDMYVQVVVETPQKLTKKQRDLLAEFDRLSSTETHPESAGFLGKVKEFLDGLGGRAGSP